MLLNQYNQTVNMQDFETVILKLKLASQPPLKSIQIEQNDLITAEICYHIDTV